MLNRFQMRQYVKDYILEYVCENPGCTVESALPAIKDRIRSDHKHDERKAAMLGVLLQLVAILLPIILELFGEQEFDDDMG